MSNETDCVERKIMKTVNPIHQSDQLHRDAGTFYRTFYDDADRVYTWFDSLSWANQLLLDEALDASKLFVRTLIPPVHQERFLPVRVDEAAFREGKKKILVYGQENVRYGDAYDYGHPAATVTGGVELPFGVTDVDLCCDLPVDPSVVLCKNEHFFIRHGTLFFRDDLFDIFPVENEPGRERSVILYLRGVSIDRRYVQDRLGVLTRSEGPSTQAFVDFNNLILDCLQEGTSRHRLSRLVAMLYDVPCTSETETVETTGVTESGRWLATNRAVYESPLAANFLASPGETVPAGTILTDAILLIRGRTFSSSSNFSAVDGSWRVERSEYEQLRCNGTLPLILERRFLGHAYQAGLIFPNEEVPLVIGRDGPWPTFRIIGREEDVRLFWRSFYERTEDRSLLAQVSSGGFLNPARFIFEQILYPRARFSLVFLDKTGPNRLPNINTRLFRDLLPPGILFSLLVVAPHQSMRLDPLHLACSHAQTYRTGPPTRLSLTLHADRFTSRRC